MEVGANRWKDKETFLQLCSAPCNWNVSVERWETFTTGPHRRGSHLSVLCTASSRVSELMSPTFHRVQWHKARVTRHETMWLCNQSHFWALHITAATKGAAVHQPISLDHSMHTWVPCPLETQPRSLWPQLAAEDQA